ncbi:MAG: VOC family protein [Solirubrobacteraceae bacterium]
MEAGTEVAVTLDDTTVFAPPLHHINLKTTRLDAMVEWYGKAVGLKPNFYAPIGAFLTNDAANHRIALTALPGLVDDPDKVTRTGMHHAAFEYGSLDELLGTYLRLKADGIEPHGCVDHGLTTSFYYLDPDGNSVELQIDNYEDWSKSTEFLRSDPRFVEDPIGKLIDPDALVHARRAGASTWEIHERAYAGELPPTRPVDMRLPMPPAP